MTALERVTAVLQHEEPDCVPACPILLMQGAAELDMGLEEYFSQGDHIAEGQLRLWEKFGHDFVFGFPHITEDITAFGAPLKYFRNGPPSPGGMAIHSYDDVFDLTVPDPESSPVLAETLRAIELLARQVKGEVPILGACIAPFSLPSMLMGTEPWMELLFVEEQSVRDEVLPHLLDIMIEFVVAWANAQLAAGADAIVLADGMSSAAVLDRQLFLELALPVVKATVPRIRGAVIHEGVGDLQPMLDLLLGTGVVGVILTSNDDLTTAKAEVGEQLTLIGNLNNIEMRRWSADDMRRRAEAALSQAAPGSGFILSAQGPEIPLGVPDDVIHAMVQAAHSWQY
jgi:uroporphyrinogen decarboxylase